MAGESLAELQAELADIAAQVNALAARGDAVLAKISAMQPRAQPQRSVKAIKAELRKRHHGGVFRA